MTTPDTPRDPGRFWAAVDAMIKADAKAKRAHENRRRADRDLVDSEQEAKRATAKILDTAGPGEISVVVTPRGSDARYLVEVRAAQGEGKEREIHIRPIEEVRIP